VAAAVRARPWPTFGIAATVFALHVILPPLVLSLARAPWTFATLNPWLKSLPAYVVSPAPLGQKLDFLSRVAVFWISADGPYGAPEWGFAIDTLDLARFLATSTLIGVYAAVWLRARDLGRAARRASALPRTGGVVGALVGALSLSTGPCSVVGCGAPVLPVIGLAFAGLSSGTLVVLSLASRVLGALVLTALLGAVAYLGWRTGPARADHAEERIPLHFERTA
jgi:hypothetical protein